MEIQKKLRAEMRANMSRQQFKEFEHGQYSSTVYDNTKKKSPKGIYRRIAKLGNET